MIVKIICSDVIFVFCLIKVLIGVVSKFVLIIISVGSKRIWCVIILLNVVFIDEINVMVNEFVIVMCIGIFNMVIIIGISKNVFFVLIIFL